ncbi:hypothetical protein N7492_005453 [Penicillium capsulatum]|uniref:Major facilitator superfamily (MFS) profile domain-containing protein n=1 Tax=Penicillium capsulatum TaxID=69766 RepID=A0A9W9I9K7_9EURO|nr:hypothetical protein N7492_005453 [Penicillium capsulatum]KAJ6135446.1 hypothetical protein N7512_000606 [Penicillium capsulatum]
MSEHPDTPFTGATPAQIDLIGTLAIALMTIGAPGGFIYAIALILASFSQALWQFFLTQGLLLGLGACLVYMPSVTVAPPWSSTNRGLAMGVILSRTGVGGVAWPLAFKSPFQRVDFRNTLRITAGVAFALITASAFFIKWPASQIRRIQVENAATARSWSFFRIPLVDWRVARTRKFAAHALGAALQSAAYYTPVFFFASFACTLGCSRATSANFIAISNTANAAGRIVIGYAADCMGRLNMLLLTTLISAISVLALWLPSALSTGGDRGSALFIAFTIFYGVFGSAYVSLFPTSLVELFGVHNFVSVNGAQYMVRGFATLLGTPLAGLLIRNNSKHQSESPRNYENPSIMVGALLFAATAAVLWVRIEAVIPMDGGQTHQRKWLM